jgi:5S rRNA maturation endonuclease (ribonuclease M5)
MKKFKKSRSYDQSKLKFISDELCDDIEELLSSLGIEDYKNLGKLIAMSCPIHGGDNETALNIYHQGDHYRGNWKCRTHQCEETFKGSILGFIRGCLSHNSHGWNKPGDPMCSFNEALEFATSFLEQDLDSIKISKKSKEKNTFVNTVKYISQSSVTDIPKISKDTIRKSLQIPSQYFLKRGFKAETLINYDVGDCISDDHDFKYMVGCTGRSFYDKCTECKSYHAPNTECPPDEIAWKNSKWRHNAGFKTQEYLYNYWIAQHRIKETSAVILVESPGNVWRLSEAGILNAVAIFGSSLSDRQKMILDTSGAMTIISIMDNDEAGRKAAEQIKNKCEKTYNIINVPITYDDVASMSITEVQTHIIPLIKDFI